MKNLLLIALAFLASCSTSGKYKAYPASGGDTITITHKQHDGHNVFNPGELIHVKNRKVIVYDTTGAKTYIIKDLIK